MVAERNISCLFLQELNVINAGTNYHGGLAVKSIARNIALKEQEIKVGKSVSIALARRV
jgi:hypothetical protein